MVLVITQHAYHLVDEDAATGFANLLVYGVTRMASVAFMAVSGMMISYFLLEARAGGSARSPSQVAARFRRRALFLLLFAHPAIQIARMGNLDEPSLGVWGQLARRLIYDYPITDTIALCLLLAPPLMLRLRPAGLLALAAGLLAVTPAVRLLWQPSAAIPSVLEAALFGSVSEEPIVGVGWPLVPWLGIFLLGGLAGGLLARARRGEIGLPALVRRLLVWAAALFGVGLGLVAAYKLFRITRSGAVPELVFQVLYPDRTTGLLPIYLSLLAVVLAGWLWHIDWRGRYDRALWGLSVLGRTSLFTYVTQFVFVHSLPAACGLRGHLDLAGVLGVAAMAVSATWLLAYGYGRARGWIAADDYRALCALGGGSALLRNARAG
jgi:hypothetical protein